jgi:hypothetical protein
VDTAFWQRVYNPADAYGGDLITGWAARFYPYLRGNATYDEPNPLLDLPIGEPGNLTAGGPGDYRGPGIRSSSVPATLSTATINVLGGAVALHAGLAFVTQDPDGGLRPVAGWHLTPAEPRIDDVIDRIVDEHPTTPPTGDPMWYASEDLAAIYRRIGSGRLGADVPNSFG